MPTVRVLELRALRVAGYPFKEDQEINAITFGSVGSATQIDHVQVSYSTTTPTNGSAVR